MSLEASGSVDALKEVLKVLTAKPRGQRARRALELIREVAPGLLALIPGVGPAAALGAKAAANVGVFAIGESHATHWLKSQRMSRRRSNASARRSRSSWSSTMRTGSTHHPQR